MFAELLLAWRTHWLTGRKLDDARDSSNYPLTPTERLSEAESFRARLEHLDGSRYAVRRQVVRDFMRQYGELPEL